VCQKTKFFLAFSESQQNQATQSKKIFSMQNFCAKKRRKMLRFVTLGITKRNIFIQKNIDWHTFAPIYKNYIANCS